MLTNALKDVRALAAQDAEFRGEIERALQLGGVAAAANVARSHGIDLPEQFEAESSELCDLELELVAGGKDGFGAIGFGGGGFGGFLGGIW